MTELTETKKHLMGLLRTAYDHEYKCTTELGSGAALVQRIRVELSRIRKRMEREKQTYKSFKVLSNVRPVPIDSVDEVTMIRTQKTSNSLSEGMSQLMKEMELG